jgi:hypothetical protein
MESSSKAHRNPIETLMADRRSIPALAVVSVMTDNISSLIA